MRNRTKALVGGTSVAAVMAAVSLTGGTSAYFYDVQTSADNSIHACSIGLNVGAATVTQTQKPTGGHTQSSPGKGPTTVETSSGALLTISGLQPGEQYKMTVPVTNTGECNADMWLDFSGHGDGVYANPPSPELAAFLQTEVKDGNKFDLTGSYAEVARDLPGKVATVAGGDTHTLVFTFTWPDGGRAGDGQPQNDNLAGGDDLTFDLDFAMVQQGVDPTANNLNSPSLRNVQSN